MIKGSKWTSILYETGLENIFISEYMPDAGELEVKTYILGRLASQMGEEVSNKEISLILKRPLEEIEDAWDYWEDLGLIAREEGTIVIREVRESIFGANIEKNDSSSFFPEKVEPQISVDNEALGKMYGKIESIWGKALSTKELEECLILIEEIGVKPEILIYAFEYGVKLNKKNFKYIRKVALNWQKEGLTTIEEIEKGLSQRDARYQEYKRIKEAMGFPRPLTEFEKNMCDRWFDEMGWSLKEVIDACSKTVNISNPNINYVNAILENWYKEQKGIDMSPKNNNKKLSRNQVLQYYDHIRNRAEREAAERTKDIEERIPQIRDLRRYIKEQGINLAKSLINGGSATGENSDSIKTNIEKSKGELNKILINHNISPDEMEVKYGCIHCKDTGVLESGELCKCYIHRSEEAKEWFSQGSKKSDQS